MKDENQIFEKLWDEKLDSMDDRCVDCYTISKEAYMAGVREAKNSVCENCFFKVGGDDVVRIQRDRMRKYEHLISIASCEEEKKALRKAYEVSRLIHIKHEDVIERSSWLLEDKK